MCEVSIIIINYNTFNLTCECIQSVISYTKSVTYEIIVVDNKSPDDDPELFLQKFPNIVLIKSDKNLGFSGGNNLGINRAKGKAILLLNSDTLLNSDSVSLAYRKLLSDEKIGVVGVQLRYPNNTIQPSAERFPSLRYLILDLFRLNKLNFNRKSITFHRYKHYNKNMFVDWIWGTFYMIKKNVVDSFPHKKFPDDFFFYSEDLQWGLEIKKLKYKIFYCSDAYIIHYGAKSGGDGSVGSKNMYTIIEMYNGKLYCKIYKTLSWLLEVTSLTKYKK